MVQAWVLVWMGKREGGLTWDCLAGTHHMAPAASWVQLDLNLTRPGAVSAHAGCLTLPLRPLACEQHAHRECGASQLSALVLQVEFGYDLTCHR